MHSTHVLFLQAGVMVMATVVSRAGHTAIVESRCGPVKALREHRRTIRQWQRSIRQKADLRLSLRQGAAYFNRPVARILERGAASCGVQPIDLLTTAIAKGGGQ
jgi:hypothetical protein